MFNHVENRPVLCDNIVVKDADDHLLGDGEPFRFLLSYDPGAEGNDDYGLTLILDALCPASSFAQLNVNGKDELTDKWSFSITRLLGVESKEIYARVSAEGADVSKQYILSCSG